MCGIYGRFSSAGGIDRDHVVANRDRLSHRGPDDEGIWISPDRCVALAHRRLSIVDLSSAGHQPMQSADARYTIVFNGEIYNHKEIRRELESRGSSFSSNSDTEVLLEAYRHWRDACPLHLNGMFAFAIYDSGTSTIAPSLYFARDRVGKKPFYYSHRNTSFEFASELKAMSDASELSLAALNFYLSLGYVPAALCISRGVCKLPPAHHGRLDLRSGSLEISRYWTLPKSEPTPIRTGDEIADEVERLLLDSTRLRLQADVPVGVLLSGGLDSSLVTAAAAKMAPSRIKTFSVSLPGSELDESARARLISQHFSTEHFDLPLDHAGLEWLDEIVPMLDEPLADSSLIPTYLVSKLTRQHVTVALGGDGGDELFGGYQDYAQSLADDRWLGWAPAAALDVASRFASRLPAGVRGRNRIASLRHGAFQQMIWGSPYFDCALRRRILTREVCEQFSNEFDAPEQFLQKLFYGGAGPVDRMTRTHFGSILPDDFMFKVDRASMMVSLEMRSPLLDHRLVEFAFRYIPDEWKVTRSGTRHIERILARRWLPPEFDRAPKMGFSIPLDDWLRRAPRTWHDAWIERLPDVIDRDEAHRLFVGLRTGRANGGRIFALFVLGVTFQNLRMKVTRR